MPPALTLPPDVEVDLPPSASGSAGNATASPALDVGPSLRLTPCGSKRDCVKRLVSSLHGEQAIKQMREQIHKKKVDYSGQP